MEIRYYPPKGLPLVVVDFYRQYFSSQDLGKVIESFKLTRTGINGGYESLQVIYPGLSPQAKKVFLAALGKTIEANKHDGMLMVTLACGIEAVIPFLSKRANTSSHAIRKLVKEITQKPNEPSSIQAMYAAVHLMKYSNQFSPKSYFTSIVLLAQLSSCKNNIIRDIATKFLRETVESIFIKMSPIKDSKTKALECIVKATEKIEGKDKRSGTLERIKLVLEQLEKNSYIRLKNAAALLNNIKKVMTEGSAVHRVEDLQLHAMIQFTSALQDGTKELITSTFMAAFCLCPQDVAKVLEKQSIIVDKSAITKMPLMLVTRTFCDLVRDSRGKDKTAFLSSLGISEQQFSLLLDNVGSLSWKLRLFRKHPGISELYSKFLFSRTKLRESVFTFQGEIPAIG